MTDKPNYSDGNWHGWNGGKCPVHPKSRVDYVWHDLNYGTVGIGYDREAIEDVGPRIAWAQVVKFRVVKEHREPREFWVVETDGVPRTFFHEGIATKYAGDFGFDVVHVREVTK